MQTLASSDTQQRLAASTQTPQAPVRPAPWEWTREVQMKDEAGAVLPGTILLFEDGSVGVYKEQNPQKEYDIVYMLKESGRAVPQGMPLANYDVEQIGRLSLPILEQLLSTGRWERDMMIFHLLRYKDRSHIPTINENTPASSEMVSRWNVRKLDASSLDAPVTTASATAEAPTADQELIRGRRLSIKFGPAQKWEAVYWGKDEMGHVVAHHTHEKWALMHLDLNRFKDTLVTGEVLPPDTLRQMEQDFQKA